MVRPRVNLLVRPLLERLRYCVNTYSNAPDQQAAETSAFIEAFALADVQLTKWV